MESKNNMIIALVPVKNEEWILPTYLSSMKMVADMVIALDDGSTDDSAKLLMEGGATIITTPFSKTVNMSEKRKLLLEEGRRQGGTHFIWLDADEAFSSHFIKNAREHIDKLKPGEKLALRWVTLWKSTTEERIDGPWKENYKDVIVYDLPEYSFENKEFSEGRTEGPNGGNIVRLPSSAGVILHFQFVDFRQAQMKQAWYRCVELTQSKRGPRRINHMYSITLDDENVRCADITDTWLEALKHETRLNDSHLHAIIALFNEHGILTFEPLEIWHIPELREEFFMRTGRKPVSKTFPRWLVWINGIKNNLFKK